MVRTRFSPSPTGYFHVGGGRSVLYNWFLARQEPDGVLILRIEDTDRERHGEEHVDGIRRAIQWLGLDWDEEYRQSERTALYAAAVERLLAQGDAYFCDCTREAIDARKKEGDPQGGYDRFCRDRGLPADGNALRFKVPLPGKTVIDDKVRGTVEFDNANIQDFVIQRADGSALFILANVVDDIDMRVTHVVRGEEHLSNTRPYELLWTALGGGEFPVFAHLSVIVNEKRQKLSKRRDSDRVVMEDYAAEGYLPAAMANYLALLGWSPSGDRVVFDSCGVLLVADPAGNILSRVSMGTWEAWSRGSVVWLPDGARLAYMAYDGVDASIRVSDAQGSVERSIAVPQFRYPGQVSSDGARLLCVDVSDWKAFDYSLATGAPVEPVSIDAAAHYANGTQATISSAFWPR